MGKDRYSDDHTIEVVGGTNTLNIEGNVSATGSLDITGGVVVGGTIESSGDVTIQYGSSISVGLVLSDGDLQLIPDEDLTIQAADISIGSTTDVIEFSSVPTLTSNVTRYITYPASSFTADYTNLDRFIDNTNDCHWDWNSTSALNLFCSITELPQGAVITSCQVMYKAEDASDEIVIFFKKRAFPNYSISGGDSYIASLTVTSPTSILSDTGSISGSISYEDHIHLVIVRLTCGSGSNNLYFYGLMIGYETNSVGL